MLQHMLVPFDNSLSSRAVVPVVAHLAHVSHGTIVFFSSTHHATHSGPHLDPPIFLLSLAESHRLEKMKELQLLARAPELAGLDVTCEVLEGSLIQAMCEAIDLFAIDTIVLSGHGPNGMLFQDSLASAVIRETHLPTIVIPHTASDDPPASMPEHPAMLVPIDGSAIAESILPFAMDLARTLQGTIILLDVLPSQTHGDEQDRQKLYDAETYLDAVKQRLTQNGISITTSLAWGDPANAIIAHAQHADMLAMATHSRQGLDKLLAGSVTEHVWQHLPIPLLFFHGEDED